MTTVEWGYRVRKWKRSFPKISSNDFHTLTDLIRDEFVGKSGFNWFESKDVGRPSWCLSFWADSGLSSSLADRFRPHRGFSILEVSWQTWGKMAKWQKEYSEVRKIEYFFPLFCFRGALLSHDFHNLSNLWLSVEENPSFCQFIEDTAYWPDVNCKVVFNASKKQFRCPIP